MKERKGTPFHEKLFFLICARYRNFFLGFSVLPLTINSCMKFNFVACSQFFFSGECLVDRIFHLPPQTVEFYTVKKNKGE